MITCSACGGNVTSYGNIYHVCPVTFAAIMKAAEPVPEPALPVVEQEELIQGTKYARLAVREDGTAALQGTGGWGVLYGSEAYAECAQHGMHVVPDPGCHCGFWIPTSAASRLGSHSTQWVALEVELAGTILDCSSDDGSLSGYRAGWQRVLSVTLHESCTWCGEPATCLTRAGRTSVYGACVIHANWPEREPMMAPAGWLRQGLQTEVRPANLLETPPPFPDPMPPAVAYVTESDPWYYYSSPYYQNAGRSARVWTWTLLPGQEAKGLQAQLDTDQLGGFPVAFGATLDAMPPPGASGSMENKWGVKWKWARQGKCVVITREVPDQALRLQERDNRYYPSGGYTWRSIGGV